MLAKVRGDEESSVLITFDQDLRVLCRRKRPQGLRLYYAEHGPVFIVFNPISQRTGVHRAAAEAKSTFVSLLRDRVPSRVRESLVRAVEQLGAPWGSDSRKCIGA